MRWLKLFESFDQQPYYQIDGREFNSNMEYNDNPYGMIRKIRSILPSNVEYTSLDSENNSISFRSKVSKWGFNVSYDELLPRTNGSHSLNAWKAVEYSDLSEEAIEFFNVRRETGRRIVTVTFSLTTYTDTVLVHFAVGPELSRKSRTFECRLYSVATLLDDKFGLLG